MSENIDEVQTRFGEIFSISARYPFSICIYVMCLQMEKVIFKSSRLSDASLRPETRPSLVHVKAPHLFGAKPLFVPMLASCKLHPWKHISLKYASN